MSSQPLSQSHTSAFGDCKIQIYQSNRLEVLLRKYIAVADIYNQADVESVFQAKICIVPNHGIGEWLTLRLAEQQGIVANLRCIAARAFQWRLYQQVLGADAVAKTPQLLNMKWRIVAFLQQFVDSDDSSEEGRALRDFLSGIHPPYRGKNPKDDQQRQQKTLFWVADHVSRLFANYVIYRDDWLSQWGEDVALNVPDLLRRESDQALSHLQENAQQTPSSVQHFKLQQAVELEQWQRFLWKKIFAEDYRQIQALERLFWQTLKAKYPDVHLQPVLVFTVQQLPPAQLIFLSRLAKYCPVFIFNYTPTQEYWVDTVDPRWLNVQQLYNADNALHYESRHPLLTRLGKHARDNHALIVKMTDGDLGHWVYAAQDGAQTVYEGFEDDDRQQRMQHCSLLTMIQYDILHLLDVEHEQKLSIASDDSIQFHVCYSLQRQLEVLKDQLIRWLSASEQHRPQDILVLLPDIMAAQHTIRSVFTDPKAERHTANFQPQANYLPIRIAGVAQQDSILLWQAIVMRLSLLDGRFGIDDWLDYIGLSPIQAVYGLSFEDVQRSTVLLEAAGFKRGFDAAHLQVSLLANHTPNPDTSAVIDGDYRYTFHYALERLALAVAMPEKAMFDDVLSLELVQRDDFRIIAILLTMYRDIDQRRSRLTEAKAVEAYADDIYQELLDFKQVAGYAQVNEDVREFQYALKMGHHAQNEHLNAQNEPAPLLLPLQLILDEIGGLLSSKVEHTAVSGSITFAQIGQLRTVPYKLVVCLEMDSGTYPRRDQELAFDLMNLLDGKLGDRSRLQDDQGAFLDALLQAQQAFWIFYNGFDINDSEVRDPSSIVQELIQHVNVITLDSQSGPDPSSLQQSIVDKLKIPPKLASLFVIHPLYPFDQNGFNQLHKRYIDQWYTVAKRLTAQSPARHWIDRKDQLPELEVGTIDGRQWIKDMIFPPRAYQRRVGIRSVQIRQQAASFEPLLADSLTRYQLRELLHSPAEFTESRAAQLQQQLQGELPVGKMRHATLQESYVKQQELMLLASSYGELTQTTLNDWHYNQQLWRVEMPVDDGTQWLSVHFGKAKSKRILTVWLQYLQWVAAHTSAQPLTRIAVMMDCTMQCSGLDHNTALQQLEKWHHAWQTACQRPLVLPSEMLAERGSLKPNSWREDETGSLIFESMDKLKQKWLGKSFYASDGFSSAYTDVGCVLHPEWALLVDKAQAESDLERDFATFAPHLYQPMSDFIEFIAHPK